MLGCPRAVLKTIKGPGTVATIRDACPMRQLTIFGFLAHSTLQNHCGTIGSLRYCTTNALYVPRLATRLRWPRQATFPSIIGILLTRTIAYIARLSKN